MLKFIVELSIAIYLTSTIFMLRNYFGTKKMLAQRGQTLKMPLHIFIYYHLMPVTHTIQLFRIERRAREIARERGRM